MNHPKKSYKPPYPSPYPPAKLSLLLFLTLLTLSLATPTQASDNAPKLQLKRVLSGLTNPVLLTHANDASGDHYIVEQAGRVLRYDRHFQPLGVFIDRRQHIRSGGEQGLLGLAFHPNYRRNGLFYLAYTANNGDNSLSEYRADPNKPKAKKTKTRDLIRIKDFASNHNGGMIAFGKDGLLYLGTGDGGGAGDPQQTAQDPSRLLGKLLRFNVQQTLAKPQIVALGLRNPWRFSIDRQNGDIYIGDVGQNAYEEIDHIRANELRQAHQQPINFGWSELEGRHCYRQTDCIKDGYRPPILEYPQTDGSCSVTGGYLIRAPKLPQLNGQYLYGDFCSGKLWLGQNNGHRWQTKQIADTHLRISSFGENQAGQIFILDYRQGSIYRLQTEL